MAENEPYPKVMIECPHLLIVSMGDQKSCSMCGSIWGGSPYPANWDERIAAAVRYEERKNARRTFWRRLLYRLARWVRSL